MSIDMSGSESRPGGWYPDPDDPDTDRWWNGISWGDQTRDRRGRPERLDARPPTAAGRHAGLDARPPMAAAPALGGGRPAARPAGPPGPEELRAEGLATAGLACGLAGLLLPMVFGPIALLLGAIAPKDHNGERRQRATAAMVLGAIELVMSGFYFVVLFPLL